MGIWVPPYTVMPFAVEVGVDLGRLGYGRVN
jgi:hypothetical protein